MKGFKLSGFFKSSEEEDALKHRAAEEDIPVAMIHQAEVWSESRGTVQPQTDVKTGPPPP